MKALKFFISLFSFLILFCCQKKKYPEENTQVGSAVYYSKILIDNQEVVIEAGVKDYYMYASYQQDSNFVYTFLADLKPQNCTSCANSLRIQINDYKVSPSGAPMGIDSSLVVQRYPILAGTPVASYSVQFNSTISDASAYAWDFGDGTVSSQPNPVKIFKQGGKYDVCLTTTGTNLCSSTICNQEKINTFNKSCKTSITAVASVNNTVEFKNSTSGGEGPYQYLWNFGDGITSTLSTVSHNYTYRGAYPVTLRVVDALGDTAYANYNAKTATDISSCNANYTKTIVSLPAEPALSTIIINWTDANGVVYTSNSIAQPKESFFEIISVSEGERNENGQPTKKIKAKFKCKLYADTRTVTLNDAEVVICVAYR